MARRRFFRMVVVALVLGVVFVASADAETPKRGGIFHVPVPDAPALDPHLSAGFVTHLYATMVYSGLVRFPAGPEARSATDERILPDLAEKWEFPTPTTVVFKLRRGVRFHRKPPVDGREVIA